MSKPLSADLVSLCTFTFADGRRCRTPRQAKHPHFCYFHAQKERERRLADRAGNNVVAGLPSDYVSSIALSATLGRLFRGVATGKIDPQKAKSLAYLAQTMLQAIPNAEREFALAFGAANVHSMFLQAYENLNPEFVEDFIRISAAARQPAKSVRPADSDSPESSSR
jgi:hypothetical protein